MMDYIQLLCRQFSFSFFIPDLYFVLNLYVDGRATSLNKEGIAYYNRLIDALLSKGNKMKTTDLSAAQY